ncbi:MAG: M4 family metallopeptidase [Thermoanaerobaculia bacterium]
MKRYIHYLAVTVLVAGSTLAQSANASAVAAAQEHFRGNRAAYGLTDSDRELKQRGARTDAQGWTHVRFDQNVNGVRVFEGEAIAHVDPNGRVSVTNALRGNLQVDTTPRISEATAIATAVNAINPRGKYDVKSELQVLPRGEHADRTQLVWHVTLYVENDVDLTGKHEFFVNARDGKVALAYDALESSGATGTAKTMYVGDQTINVDLTDKYYLRDLTRGGGNYTVDLNGGTSGGAIVSSTTSTFGDGVKTDCSGGPNDVTAAAEVHFGMAASWDYYKNAFGRNGINGAGKQAYSRVHYSNCYQNAFWSDSCFCMTYGDGGSTFYPLTSIDVAGHEMSHGVMATEANLTYRGESGGLNESNSDIFGTMIEYSMNSAADPGDYWIGERIYRSNYAANGTYTQSKALRYMDDPKKDGVSPACWSKQLKSLDVHYSSGPNNHMFYLLAEGGTSKCNSTVVTGLGRAKAAAIWYEAITNWMTSSTNYAGARTAALNAAARLYGSGSPEYNAVAKAYSAINVN